jgi:cephalosporin hydroxylase
MSYEEMLAEAKAKSDHHDRVTELEPALMASLSATDPTLPVLEIGNRDGGSGILIMWHARPREFVSCDIGPAPGIFAEWSAKLGVRHTHFQSSQKDFINGEAKNHTWGFVYFDADHREEDVMEDMKAMVPYLARGCILAVDDVNEWSSLPEVEGLEMVDFHMDEGTSLGKHGHHFMAWRKL